MEYEDLVDETDAAGAEEGVEADAADPAVEKRAPGWKAVIITGLLAGLIGTGGGAAALYYGISYGLKTQSPDMTQLKAELQQELRAEMTALTSRLSAVENTADEAANRLLPEFDMAPMDLSPLEARIIALENAPSPEIDPDALSALQAAQADGFEWPNVDDLNDRLAALENRPIATTDPSVSPEMLLEMADRIDALEAASALAVAPALPTDLLARIDALENRPVVTPEKQIIPVLAFPKQAMLRATEDMATGGFIERTLSKHVRVKDDDDPRTLIEGIEADLSEGRLDLAANKYESLPAPVQQVARAWYESVQQANIKAAP